MRPQPKGNADQAMTSDTWEALEIKLRNAEYPKQANVMAWKTQDNRDKARVKYRKHLVLGADKKYILPSMIHIMMVGYDREMERRYKRGGGGRVDTLPQVALAAVTVMMAVMA